MNSWLDYETRFRALSPRISDARLDVQTGVAGEHWRVAGGFDRRAIEEFEILCGLSGRELTIVWRNDPSFREVLEHDEPKVRWYRALREMKGAYVPGPVAQQLDDEGNPNGFILTGSIDRIAEVSANFCLSLHSSHPLNKEINERSKELIEPEAPWFLKWFKWGQRNWKSHPFIVSVTSLIILIAISISLLPIITFIRQTNSEFKDKMSINGSTSSLPMPNTTIPDISQARREVLITSIDQFESPKGLVDVSTNIPGYFELAATPSSGSYSYSCVETKTKFGTHFVSSVRMAALEGAGVLELQGRDIWFAIDARLNSYFIFESEENWTIWRELKVERRPDINNLLIYQNGRIVQVFLNGKYVDTFTKFKTPNRGSIGICFKANPQEGGRLHFQKLSIWEF